MELKSNINGWKKARSKKGQFGTSIFYVKGNYSLEIFQDSSWMNGKNYREVSANVIVRDKSQQSYESALGKDIKIIYCDTFREAEIKALSYMEYN